MGAKTGAVTAVQRTSSDLRLNPHLHTIALDGAWYDQGSELLFAGLGHLKTREVGDVLEHAIRRIAAHLDRRGLLGTRDDDLDLSGEGDSESNLASSAVSGQSPPAGPQSPEGRLRAGRLAFDCPSCAHSPTTSHSAHRLMGSPCTRPPARAGSTPRVARHCCAMSCVARGQAARSSNCARAIGATPRRPRSHHPEEGVRRRDGCGRHGSTVAQGLPATSQAGFCPPKPPRDSTSTPCL